MAYPRLRSMNADLDKGATDGTYKQVAPDRGGVVESSFMEMRRHLDDVWHGQREAPDKYIMGRCKVANTPGYFPTPAPDMDRW
jgi:hypothetical protein